MEKNKVEKEIQNMELVRDEIKRIEDNAFSQFKSTDDKLNMLLVFNAGLLLLLPYIIPSQTNNCFLMCLKWICFIAFILLNLSSVITIFLGFKLRLISMIQVDNLDTEEIYQTNNDDLLHNFIQRHKETIQSQRKAINIKQNRFTLAMILNIVNTCVVVLGIILNLI